MAQDSDLCYLTIISKAHLQQFEDMVATGQEIVREKKNSSRSGKSQGISL